MGTSTTTKPEAAPQGPALETPDSVHAPGAAGAKAIVGDTTDSFLLAFMIRNNPRHADDIVALLSERFGMAFVLGVLFQVEGLKGQFGGPASDHGSSYEDKISSGKGIENKGIKNKPDPKERLPYDKDGGWDGVLINCKLGQHDKIAGTDSDGARCSFAVALASQIFNGPTACASWLIEYVNSRAPRAKKGKEGGLDGMSTRKRAAALTIGSVADAIGAGTATYGDLSWAQEGMHAYLRDEEDQGTGGAKDTIVPALENYQELNSVAEDGASVMARASALQPGGRLILVLVGVFGDDRPDYYHQLAIMNDTGKLYLYDPENPTGTHLEPASAKSLAKYLDPQVFSSASFLIQGMVWPKTETAAP